MKTRNLHQYINILTNQALVSKIGTKDDPLLTRLSGETDLGQYIGTLTKFATNSEAQVFYEFLQNADDAQANTVFFYFREGHFVVINDGKPFYTDQPKSDGNGLRKGQLKAFLSKGDKYDDPESVGKYGRGSKLLYDLLIPVQHGEGIGVTLEEGLKEHILKKHAGPILFSWSDLSDLERLLSWNASMDVIPTDCTNDTIPLLTKLIFTYYPATLGEIKNTLNGAEVPLFTTQELVRCVSFLREIRPVLPIFGFSEGTLLYIPLGENQHLKMQKNLEDSLLPGIRTSLAFLNKLSQVLVQGEKVDKTNFHRLQLQPISSSEKQHPVTLAFPDQPAELDTELVNFYQFFPIAKTAFGLKIIIDSEAYEIDSARQDIDLSKSRNAKVMEVLGERLQDCIRELRNEDNRQMHCALLQSILATDQYKIKSNQIICEHFYENLLATVAQNLPTTNGYADATSAARIKNTLLPIQPADLGFMDWDWIDENLKPVYDNLNDIKIGVEVYTIVNLLRECPDRDKLENWLNSLSTQEYHQLLIEIQEHTGTYQEIAKLPFLRFSNNKIYTPGEVTEDENLVLVFPETSTITPVCQRLAIPFGGLELFADFGELHRRFTQKPEYSGEPYYRRLSNVFSGKDLERDEKWALFQAFSANAPANKLLREELRIFVNQAGEKRPLGSLLKNASNLAPSGILHPWSVRASDNYFNELESWLIQPEEIWEHLVNDWEDLNQPLTPVANSRQLISDLNRIYSRNDGNKKTSDNLKWLPSEEGQWVSSAEVFYHEKLQGLSGADYFDLCKLVKRATNLKIIPHAELSGLETIEFAELPSCGLKILSDKWEQNELIASIRELELLNRLKRNSEGFFEQFTISGTDDPSEYLLKIREGKEIQFASTDTVLCNFLAAQGYVPLPAELYNLFSDDNHLQREDEDFALQLLDRFGARPEFLELILRLPFGEKLKREFLDKIDRINLTSEPNPSHYRGTFEGRLIQIIVSQHWENDFRRKIFIDDVPLDQFDVKEEVNVLCVSTPVVEPHQVRFNLSELLPRFVGISDVLAIVRGKLDDKGNLFRSSPFPQDDLTHEIMQSGRVSSTLQACFLIAYFKSEEGIQRYSKSEFQTLDFSDIPQEDALEEFYRKNLYFFTDFPFPSEWFNLRTYVNAAQQDHDLLLPRERIPDWILQWIREGETDKKISFLTKAGLADETSHVLEFRRDFRRGESIRMKTVEELARDQWFADNTFDWMLTQNTLQPFDYDRENAKAFHNLSHCFFSSQGQLTSCFLIFEKNSTHKVKITRLPYPKGAFFIHGDLKDDLEVWASAFSQLTGSTFIALNPHQYTESYQKRLIAEGMQEAILEKDLSAQQQGNLQIWRNRHYDLWKANEGQDYQIFVLNTEIPFDYYLLANGSRQKIGQFNKGKVARKDSEVPYQLYVYQENSAENIFKILADNQEELFPNKEAELLVKLLSYQLNETSSPESTAGGNLQNFTSEEQKKLDENHVNLKVILNASKQPELENMAQNLPFIHQILKLTQESDREKLLENLDLVSQLLQKADQDLLTLLLEHFDDLKSLLDRKAKKVTPNSIVGWIGERLVYLWLIKLYGEQNVEYVAQDVWEYDIEFNIDGNNYKIDTKTTIKSVREEGDTIPFFIKRSQYNYLQTNPDENYFIARLSLKDLGLEDVYDRLKNMTLSFDEMIAEIDQKLSLYIDFPGFSQRFRRNRMVFKMAMPVAERDILK